jgi:hypothetical protein
MATALTNTGVLFPDATTQTTASVLSFTSGTVMLFVQTSAPTGWTKSTAHNDKALRLVSGTAGSGGSAVFTTAFGTPSVSGSVSLSGTTGNSTAGGSLGGPSATTSVSGISPGSGFPAVSVASSGHGHSFTGSAHNHSFSSSGSLSSATAAINVQYVDVIIATKD